MIGSKLALTILLFALLSGVFLPACSGGKVSEESILIELARVYFEAVQEFDEASVKQNTTAEMFDLFLQVKSRAEITREMKTELQSAQLESVRVLENDGSRAVVETVIRSNSGFASDRLICEKKDGRWLVSGRSQ